MFKKEFGKNSKHTLSGSIWKLCALKFSSFSNKYLECWISKMSFIKKICKTVYILNDIQVKTTETILQCFLKLLANLAFIKIKFPLFPLHEHIPQAFSWPN